MFLILLLATFAGVFIFRFWDYWRWLLYAFIWAVIALVLLASKGSSQNPAGDGFLTQLIRRVFDNESIVSVFALTFTIIAWGVLLLLLARAGYAAWTILRSGERTPFIPARRKMLEFLALAVFLILLQLPSFLGRPPDFPGLLAAIVGGDAGSVDPVVTMLSAASAEENKRLPVQVDNITTLERTSVEGRTWTFFYTVNLDSSQRDAAIKFADDSAPRLACQDQGMRPRMRDDEVTYRFRYIIGGNLEPHIVSVDESTCRELGI